jgi:protein-L-isoaspartate(D-aspartate) O-methyltransferase
MPFDFSGKKLSLLAELRRDGISDERVLKAVESIPRELFVPATFQDRAYENIPLPIGRAQTISQPFIVALMTQMLQVDDKHCVLEIGTGSGYQAAVLSRLCRRVFTLERHQTLLQEAQKRFAALRIHNITSRFGDGTKGWPEAAPYDRIIVTAAAPELPLRLVAQLRDGGVMIAPVGPERRDQRLVRVRRNGDGHDLEELGEVRFVPLVRGLPRERATQKEE